MLPVGYGFGFGIAVFLRDENQTPAQARRAHGQFEGSANDALSQTDDK